MEKIFAWGSDEICIYVLQNTNMEKKKIAWRFDDNIAVNHSWLFVGRAEFGMKQKKKNLLKVLQAEDLFGAVEAAAGPWQLK